MQSLVQLPYLKGQHYNRLQLLIFTEKVPEYEVAIDVVDFRKAFVSVPHNHLLK